MSDEQFNIEPTPEQKAAAAAEEKAAAADALAAAFAARAEREASHMKDESGLVPLEGGVGLGVDIVEIERMVKILGRTPRFRERVYSEEERTYCDKMAKPAVHYAMRFAAKEAVLKALGTGFSAGIAPRDVEVCRNANGRPVVALHGKAAEAAKKLGVKEIPISLSYTHSDAVACAMALTRGSEKVVEERVDPMAELAQQFKDARALLDELPVTDDRVQPEQAPDDAIQVVSQATSGDEPTEAPVPDAVEAVPGQE